MIRLHKSYLAFALTLALGWLVLTPPWRSGAAPVAANSAADYGLFLPTVHYAKPYTGIHGLVTEKGDPASGIDLELRFYNGSAWSTKAATVTNADGYFSFTGMPALGPDQLYYVLYLNVDDPNHLYIWGTRVLESYNAGAAVPIGNFDVANIELLTPAPGATTGLPATFTWDRRSAVPTDNYEFNLFDPDDGDPYFYTVPPLGYVSSYVLGGLPADFSPGVPYAWNMWVYGDEDLESGGISYWAYYVTFSGSALSLAPIETHKTLRQPDNVEALHFRQRLTQP